MRLPISLTRLVRGAVAALAAFTLLVSVPTQASAEKPRPKRPAAAASRSGAKASRAAKARRAAVKPRASRRAASGRTAKASSRSAARNRRLSPAARRRLARAQRRARGPVVPSVEPAAFVSDSADQLRDSIVSLARQQIGTPYIWGAETPGSAFDCSGLVKYVMSWLNVKLPRTANEQAYTGIRIGRNLDRMKPGDLLTFGNGRRITHIAIYSGNGKYVHASRPGVGVIESLLDPSQRRFKGAIRLVADADSTLTNALTRQQILR